MTDCKHLRTLGNKEGPGYNMCDKTDSPCHEEGCAAWPTPMSDFDMKAGRKILRRSEGSSLAAVYPIVAALENSLRSALGHINQLEAQVPTLLEQLKCLEVTTERIKGLMAENEEWKSIGDQGVRLLEKRRKRIKELESDNAMLRDECKDASEAVEALMNAVEELEWKVGWTLLSRAAQTAWEQHKKPEPTRHVCGMRGFGMHHSDRCPACEESK